MNTRIYHHVQYALIYTRLARLTRIKISIHVYMPVYSLSMELLQLPMTMMILPWSYYERVDNDDLTMVILRESRHLSLTMTMMILPW